MQILLLEPEDRVAFLPLTFTDFFANLYVGIFTFKERWEYYLQQPVQLAGPAYLKPASVYTEKDMLSINSAAIPNQKLVDEIWALPQETSLYCGTQWIATRGFCADPTPKKVQASAKHKRNTEEGYVLEKIWQLLNIHERLLQQDCARYTSTPAALAGVYQLKSEHIYIHPTAQIGAGTVLNATTGPIFIGENARVLEGTLIRGPLALCTNSEIKMGSKLYGPVSVAPHCKVGGEISQSIFQSYSNKAHDGFVGNSLIGKWCNLGAGTNTSNLKNNYQKVAVYKYETQQMTQTDQQFLGAILGDHTKTAIGSRLNTGSMTGIFVNFFGEKLSEKFIPSFSWHAEENQAYNYEKAIKTAEIVLKRRGLTLSAAQQEIYRYLFDNRENPTFGINFA